MEKVKGLNKEISFINYLKALAIIMIVYTHTYHADICRTNFISKYFIDMAVPIFMLITGFNYALSYTKRNASNWSNLYSIKILLKRFLRLTIPFIIILLLEWGLNISDMQNCHHFSTYFFRGGIGPGSYYYPVMLQILILYPLIYVSLQKYGKKALFCIFALNILWDALSCICSIKAADYRLIAFRYLFYIALGTWLIISKNIIPKERLIFIFVIGLNAITILTLGNKDLYWPFLQWTSTSVLTALYLFPIFAYVYYKYNNFKINNWCGSLMELIGKASWHIFLVQMLMFSILYNHESFNSSLTHFWQALLIVLAFGFVGIIFYLSDKKIITPIYKKYLP